MMKIIAIEEHFRTAVMLRATHPDQALPRPDAADADPMAARLRKLDDLGTGRLADMDAAGIDVQVLSHTTPTTELLDAAAAVPLARATNDLLAAAVAAHPDRFAGFATLPTPDPAAAAGELERAVRALGFKGAMINGPTQGRFLDDQFFWPILERAEDLGVPLYLHPSVPPAAVRAAYYEGFSPRVSQALATGAWGWHVETGLHMLRLILGGVFDRFPRLQLILGHMGEALPFMLARADAQLTPVANLQRSVQDYLLRHVHFTTSGLFTYPPLLCLLQVVGVERVIFSVDYPYSTNEQGRAFLDGAPLDAAARAQIAHGNAERLLHL
jgi:predicted TIM-barrel fold metal-dependent hydrolase